VIFVSIDDNEQANLKLLMDEIFGEGNFVAEIIWANKEGGGGSDSTHFKVKHEYISCYARNKYLFSINGEMCIEDSSYNYEDSFVEERGKYKLIKLNSFSIQYSASLDYPITLPNGNTIFPSEDGKKGCWRWSREKYDWGKKEGFIEFKDNQNGKLWVYTKQYFKVDNENKSIIRTLPPDALIEKYSSTMATKQLETLFNCDSIFSYSKPSPLLYELIYSGTQKDSLILDFFAGSATTAHAVMQLNAEDGGNRKFIMVQIDEETNPDSEARKAGYKTIDEIARARISLAGKKILAEYESDLAKQSNGWDKDIGFKHYRLITPDIKTIDKITEFNPDETNLIADDMIKPFAYKDTNTKGLDTILTTWLIDDGYRFDTPIEEITFGKYTAHYVREAATLYLINSDWDTKALIPMLNQIGRSQLLVKTIVVYPYSFTFEAMRELKTNIKTNLDPSPNLIERF
jgi:adenine-specific DNA-methyltransferase